MTYKNISHGSTQMKQNAGKALQGSINAFKRAKPLRQHILALSAFIGVHLWLVFF